MNNTPITRYGGRTEIINPDDLYVPPTEEQFRIILSRGSSLPDSEVVERVKQNRPMPGMSRIPEEDNALIDGNVNSLQRAVLQRTFPQLYQTLEGRGFEDLEDSVQKAIEELKRIGCEKQAEKLFDLLDSFTSTSRALGVIDIHGRLSSHSFLNLKYLTDLFMAVPVWYFVNTEGMFFDQGDPNDPKIAPRLLYFCEKFQTQRWWDTFLMFNRRVRTIQDYDGDIIPRRTARIIQETTGLFDHLVIMTPYHNKAGRDWDEIRWGKINIDPYLVGFIHDFPYAVILDRFSDSGLFPLYMEMVADTIHFLRTNLDKIQTCFGKVTRPFWFYGFSGSEYKSNFNLGNHLRQNTQELLRAFDDCVLFDWLRGERS
jgi:hypothetical protein